VQPHHLAADQRLPPPHSACIEEEAEDEYRSRRRRRLQESQRKSRSLDVYEPSVTTGNPASGRASGVGRLRRSSVRVTDELPERTHRVARCSDISPAGQEQRYATSLPYCIPVFIPF